MTRSEVLDGKMAAVKETSGASPKRGKKERLAPLSGSTEADGIIERARRYGPECIDALAEVAASGTDASRVAAARELLERGFGKAGQPLEFSGEDDGSAKPEIALSPSVAAILRAAAGSGETP
jgi:hypothetical protein